MPTPYNLNLSGECNSILCVTIDSNNFYPPPYYIILDGITAKTVTDIGTTISCFSGICCGDHTVEINSLYNQSNFYTEIDYVNNNIVPNKGFLPLGSLFQASNGNFYGMANYHTSGLKGVVFSCGTTGGYSEGDPSLRWEFGTIPSDGESPTGNFIEPTVGVLFAMTPLGGSVNEGTIFQIDLLTGVRTNLYEFNYFLTSGRDPKNPYGSFFKASDGLLYALSPNGGINDKGALFTFDYLATGNPPIVVHDFDNTTSQPYGNVIEPSLGFLLGTYYENNLQRFGGIFSYEISTGLFVKNDFLSILDGLNPTGSLTSDPSWTNYVMGMTSSGGSNNYGTIFGCGYQPNPGSFNFDTQPLQIYEFDWINGAYPKGDLLADGNILYGMTSQGGAFGEGVIFKFNIIGTIYNVIYHFRNTIPNQYNPVANLIKANDGFLYGMTPGNIKNTPIPGTIFKLDSNGIQDCKTILNETIYCLYLNTLNVDISCRDNGSVTVEGLGIDPPFYFQMTNGLVTFTSTTLSQGEDVIFSGLSADIWQLILTDSNNRSFIESYDLTPFGQISITVNNDNSICLHRTGTTMFEEVILNGNVVFYNLIGFDRGCFSGQCGQNLITLSSVTGCYQNYLINIDCPLTVSGYTIVDPFCCDGPAALYVKAESQNLPITYTIHNIPTTATYTNNTGNFTNISPPTGIWELIVTDALGNTYTNNFILNYNYHADIIFGSHDATVTFTGGDRTIITINGSAFTYNFSAGTEIFNLECGIDNIITVTGYYGNASTIIPYGCDVLFSWNNDYVGYMYSFNPNPLLYPATPQTITNPSSFQAAVYATRGYDKIYFIDSDFLTNQYYIVSYSLTTTPIGPYTIEYNLNPPPSTFKGVALKEEDPITGNKFFILNSATNSVDFYTFILPTTVPTSTSTLFTIPSPYVLNNLIPYDRFDNLYYDAINNNLFIIFEPTANPNNFTIFDLTGNLLRAGSPPGLYKAKGVFMYGGQIYVVDENGGLWLVTFDPINPLGLFFNTISNFMNFPSNIINFNRNMYGFVQYNNGNENCNIEDICTYSASTFPPCPMECNVTVVPPRCQGQDADSMTVTITGGYPDFNITLFNDTSVYTGSTSSHTYTFVSGGNVHLVTGNWSLTVIDSYGNLCINDNIVITPTFHADYTATTSGICFTVTGGSEPYVIILDGVPQIPPGYIYQNGQIYCLELSCGTHSILIEETVPAGEIPCHYIIDYVRPCILVGSTYTTNPGCNGSCTGTITISVTGNSPYTYSLINNTTGTSLLWGPTIQNSYTFQNLCSGTYDILVLAHDGSVYVNTGVTLDYVYDVIAIGYPNTSACTEGSICVGITGGTPPYDIYIDGSIALSATFLTNACFTATCGTDHIYEVYDSSPPCNIPVNNTLLCDPIISGTTCWIYQSKGSNCNCTGEDIFASGGSITFTADCAVLQIAGCSENFEITQDGFYTYPLPLSVTYTLDMYTGDLSNCSDVQMYLNTPFGSLTIPDGMINSTTLATVDNGHYLVNNITIPTTIIPPSTPYQGFGTFFEIGPSGGPLQFQLDYFQLTINSYTIDCRCSASGTTYVPCNPPLGFTYTYTQPNCNNACDGQIIMTVTGGTPGYTYTATNGTTILINNSGVFTDVCEGDWNLMVSDTCGSVLTGNSFTLHATFEATIVTYPTQFCVTISGGTAPFHIYANSIEIATVGTVGTYCYPAECGVDTIIRVVDSSDLGGI